MAVTERKRADPRREQTRIALIEAAESLFAEAGVDAVSTRRIGAAIGSLNTNVVAYHFGSKEALIDAVYHHRLPAIDARRGELLRALEAQGRASDIATLLVAFALPLFEQRDASGRHSYARFLDAIERAGLSARRALVSASFPETDRLLSHIAAALPAEAVAGLGTRLRLVTGMLTAALRILDAEGPHDAAAAREQFEQVVVMATAALIARPSSVTGATK